MGFFLRLKLGFNNIKYFFILLSLTFTLSSLASNTKVKYRTSFGKCPSRTAGALTLKLIKLFEDTDSLRSLKKKIIDEKLFKRHFLSKYEIKFDPMTRMLNFNYDCPEPLMKVQVYKDKGHESYNALLVEGGKIFDPTYEILLRNEKKLNYELPSLAIPVKDFNEETQQRLTDVVGIENVSFRKKISEIILDEEQALTIILSIQGNPSSVFIGKDEWKEKITKLKKIISYMELKKKIPAVINLTNSKKVVVKFNDNF